VDANTYLVLQGVDNLKKGRCSAHEYRKIKPVDEKVVEQTPPHLPPVVKDMVRVQLFCGMRPQDVCNMKPIDIDRSCDIWKYVPYTHKTEHEDKDWIIAIGPNSKRVRRNFFAAGLSST